MRSTHPYYDPKTDKESPKWFMVGVKFVSRAEHFVSLSLLRYVAGLPSVEPPEEIAYIGSEGVKAIKDMALLNRGRLSVQRVSEECWDVIGQMAQRGGWDDPSFSQNVGKSKSRSKRKPATERTEQGVEDGAKDSLGEHTGPDGIAEEHAGTSKGKRGRKRKELDGEVVAIVAPRRKSARTK
ncbi:hypothetical protein ID866_2601 [Astraeus odoratus]|nr:hypothetical protein ID866_2601 [Astraeus odoratus]